MAGLREPHKLIVTTVTVTSSGHSFNYYIITFLHFLYQALQCFMKFQVNSEGITLQTEMTARRHRFEIRSEMHSGTAFYCAYKPRRHQRRWGLL